MINFSAAEGCATDNHLLGAPAQNLLGARGAADPAADTNPRLCAAAERANQTAVVPAPHCGVEVDHMQQRIGSKAVEQAKNVVHG